MNINTVKLILHTWIEIGAWDVEILIGKKWGHEDVDAMHHWGVGGQNSKKRIVSMYVLYMSTYSTNMDYLERYVNMWL